MQLDCMDLQPSSSLVVNYGGLPQRMLIVEAVTRLIGDILNEDHFDRKFAFSHSVYNQLSVTEKCAVALKFVSSLILDRPIERNIVIDGFINAIFSEVNFSAIEGCCDAEGCVGKKGTQQYLGETIEQMFSAASRDVEDGSNIEKLKEGTADQDLVERATMALRNGMLGSNECVLLVAGNDSRPIIYDQRVADQYGMQYMFAPIPHLTPGDIKAVHDAIAACPYEQYNMHATDAQARRCPTTSALALEMSRALDRVEKLGRRLRDIPVHTLSDDWDATDDGVGVYRPMVPVLPGSADALADTAHRPPTVATPPAIGDRAPAQAAAAAAATAILSGGTAGTGRARRRKRGGGGGGGGGTGGSGRSATGTTGGCACHHHSEGLTTGSNGNAGGLSPSAGSAQYNPATNAFIDRLTRAMQSFEIVVDTEEGGDQAAAASTAPTSVGAPSSTVLDRHLYLNTAREVLTNNKANIDAVLRYLAPLEPDQKRQLACLSLQEVVRMVDHSPLWLSLRLHIRTHLLESGTWPICFADHKLGVLLYFNHSDRTHFLSLLSATPNDMTLSLIVAYSAVFCTEGRNADMDARVLRHLATFEDPETQYTEVISQIASRVWETLYEKARARVALAQEQERKQAAADQACLALIMEEVEQTEKQKAISQKRREKKQRRKAKLRAERERKAAEEAAAAQQEQARTLNKLAQEAITLDATEVLETQNNPQSGSIYPSCDFMQATSSMVAPAAQDSPQSFQRLLLKVRQAELAAKQAHLVALQLNLEGKRALSECLAHLQLEKQQRSTQGGRRAGGKAQALRRRRQARAKEVKVDELERQLAVADERAAALLREWKEGEEALKQHPEYTPVRAERGHEAAGGNMDALTHVSKGASMVQQQVDLVTDEVADEVGDNATGNESMHRESDGTARSAAAPSTAAQASSTAVDAGSGKATNAGTDKRETIPPAAEPKQSTTTAVSSTQPSSKQPISKQPSSKQPSSKQPSSKQPSSKQPTSKQSTTAPLSPQQTSQSTLSVLSPPSEAQLHSGVAVSAANHSHPAAQHPSSVQWQQQQQQQQGAVQGRTPCFSQSLCRPVQNVAPPRAEAMPSDSTAYSYGSSDHAAPHIHVSSDTGSDSQAERLQMHHLLGGLADDLIDMGSDTTTISHTTPTAATAWHSNTSAHGPLSAQSDLPSTTASAAYDYSPWSALNTPAPRSSMVGAGGYGGGIGGAPMGYADAPSGPLAMASHPAMWPQVTPTHPSAVSDPMPSLVLPAAPADASGHMLPSGLPHGAGFGVGYTAPPPPASYAALQPHAGRDVGHDYLAYPGTPFDTLYHALNSPPPSFGFFGDQS